MNETIKYYNDNAAAYYDSTVNADLTTIREAFASFLPDGATIIDIGCGSGRDVKAFCDLGYKAIGLDSSEELAKLAKEKLGIDVIIGDMSSWVSDVPYDGIWSCASLIHLNDIEKVQFFKDLEQNLKSGGIIYISVKEGVETGIDEKGRFISNCTFEKLQKYLQDADCRVIEKIITEDKLDRDTKWLNVIAKKNGQIAE